MQKRVSATELALIVSLLILQACSKIPCYPAYHFRPPANANYTATDVHLLAPAGHTLAGTLTLPSDRSPPYPAVVLVTGSSPQNRDMMGHWAWPASAYRPFRQIADALSSNGIAVLRMDDRGYGCSEGGPLCDATTVERADDNRAMVDFLRNRSDIDPSRIGILGLSEGGNIGPLIAASDPTICALVIMAGCATNGWKIQEHQYRYDIERDQNLSEEEKKKALAAKMKDLRVAVREGKASPWFTFFLDYMPLPTAKQVACPVLILHGDRDAHVPVEHAHYLAQAMRSSGNPDVTVRISKDINHPFLADTDGRKSGYMTLLRKGAKVPDSVLDTISDWFVVRLLDDH